MMRKIRFLYVYTRTMQQEKFNRLSERVNFSIAMMSGIKTVLKTESHFISKDIPQNDWHSLIFKLSMKHYNNSDYIVLSQGYIRY